MPENRDYTTEPQLIDQRLREFTQASTQTYTDVELKHFLVTWRFLPLGSPGGQMRVRATTPEEAIGVVRSQQPRHRKSDKSWYGGYRAAVIQDPEGGTNA